MRSDRVARVVDFIEDQSFGLVLVMDFVEGELLGNVLAKRKLGIEEAVDLGVDIVTALADLHHVKVVHRDLKPDNIILEPLRGDRVRAVIVDLGLGRLDVDLSAEDAISGITQVDMAIGTLPYMAPEQVLSSRTATGVADLYAAGAILFRAVSGKHVFGDVDDVVAARRKIAGEAPPLDVKRVDRVAKGLAAVVARALRREPEKRYATAEEMLADLTALQDLARAMSLDLDAATELAPSSLIHTSVRPEAPTSLPSIMDDIADEPSEATRLMPRAAPGHAFFDEETQLAEVSTKLAPPSVRLAEGRPLPDLSGVTVPPSELKALAAALEATTPATRAPVAADPPEKSAVAPKPAPRPVPLAVVERAPRTISLRAAGVGLVAALAVGVVLGFEAYRLLGP
jgi:serine/threonine-protein kinase